MTLAAVSEAASIGLVIPLLGALIGEEDALGADRAVDWVNGTLSEMFPGQDLLLLIGILIAVVFTLKAALKILSSYLSISFLLVVEYRWIVQMLAQYLWTDYKTLSQQRRGALINNVVFETRQASKCIKFTLQYLSQLLVVCATFALMLVVNWQVTLALSAIAGLLTSLLWVSSHRYSRNVGRQSVNLNQGVGAQAEEGLRAVREVKMFGLETRIVNSLKERADELVRITIGFRVLNGIPIPISELFVVLVFLMALGFMEFTTPGGLSGILPLLAFLVLAAQKMFQKGSQAISGSMALTRFVPSLALVKQVVSTAADPAVTAHVEPHDASGDTGYRSGDIVLSDVTFAYEEDRGPVIHEVSLDIPMRSTIGILGTTGSGKSTILDLICGLYSDYQGTISVGGQDMRGINFEDWRRGIGLVGQQPVLFRGTIRDNITLGNLHASTANVEEAARKAQAHEFIARLPSGYDTELSDGGALSVGQKQRLAIARVIYRDPWLYLFDEATSGLDLKTEAFVKEFFTSLEGTKTVVIVTHRHSSVCDADKVYVLEQGRILEQGRFKDLQTIPIETEFRPSTP